MNVNKAYNEFGSNKYCKIHMSVQVIMHVTHHLKGFFCSKVILYLVCLFHIILVNVFYFHKYSCIFN